MVNNVGIFFLYQFACKYKYKFLYLQAFLHFFWKLCILNVVWTTDAIISDSPARHPGTLKDIDDSSLFLKPMPLMFQPVEWSVIKDEIRH